MQSAAMRQPGDKKVVKRPMLLRHWSVAEHEPGYIVQRTTAHIDYCAYRRTHINPSVFVIFNFIPRHVKRDHVSNKKNWP